MPKSPKSPVPGTGSLTFSNIVKGEGPVPPTQTAPVQLAPGLGLPKTGPEARKPDPHWAGKQGRGFAPVQKPLRLPGKGRGG